MRSEPASAGHHKGPLQRWVFGPMELADGDGWLRIDGREVPVQPGPLKLLRALLAAAPGVVTHEELIARIWQRGPQMVSRTILSSTVARLREALGTDLAANLVAVAGVGYRWRGAVRSVPIAPAADTPATLSSIATAETPQAEADRFMTRLWLDVLRGRSAGHARMTLHQAVHAGIAQAEAELTDAPAVLACIHRTLASHRLMAHDGAGAIHHFRRAWALAAASLGEPQPDLALELHFELCCALVNSVLWDGDAARLRAARSELALARSALRASPEAGAAVRLGAARAAFAIAFYEHDWTRALAASAEVVRETDALPEPDPRRRWECRIHHATILLRAGDEADAIAAIDDLFRQPPPPLNPGDIMLLQARMVRGAIHACIGRHAEAVALLEPLHAELAADGRADSGVGPDTATWLAGSLLQTGRDGEALAMIRTVHGHAVAQVGASSEAALQPLATLALALAAAGRADDALRHLEEGVGPLLPRLVMPGQRYAVLALARWIDLLFERGDTVRAIALLRHLRPRDLRAAVLRPADAETFFERCRRAREATPVAQPTQGAGAA